MGNSLLNKYKANIWSQFGEDGIIGALLADMQFYHKGTCLEVGAWDGLRGSNVAYLWRNLAWKAYLIETDEERFQELKENTQDYDCELINMHLQIDGSESLNGGRFEDVDVLCIDIDSYDYHVFKNMTIRPKIVIVEHNPSLPPFISIHGDETSVMGASAQALVDVAEDKGYAFVAMTHCNVIFVDKSIKSLEHYHSTVVDYFDPKDSVLTYACTDYDGGVFYVFANNKLKFMDKKCEVPSFGFYDWTQNDVYVENSKVWRGFLDKR